MTREFPHDPVAEQSLIGACLLSDTAVEAAEALLAPDDFHTAAHQNIWRSILDVYHHGKVDVVTVADDLKVNGHQGDAYTVGKLASYTADTPSVANAARYARIVAGHALRRRIIAAGAAIAEAGWDTPDAEMALEASRSLLDGFDAPMGKPVPDPDYMTFLDDHAVEYDWIIPDMLEHRDRLLITASEGAGKSVLCTQIGFMTAAGIHCWTRGAIQPRNVAIIDLENSPRMMSRRLAWMRDAAQKSGVIVDRQRLRIHARPEGIDLTKRPDKRWLIERCMANQTELLVIGPAYRMSAGAVAKGDVGGEDQARTVTKALDEIRNRCNVTLVMETHAPHGGAHGRDLRPFGSSVWLRWPEFGVGIRKDSEDGNTFSFEHWRGPRDQRTWPLTLQKKRSAWPWTATMPRVGAA